MKHKIVISLLCLMSLSSVFAQAPLGIGDMIYLFPVHTCVPMDNDHNNGRDETDPNQIRAIINGKDLSIKADTDMPARAEVRKENGALVARQDFIDETEISLPAAGNYTIRISSGKTTVEGSFTAK